jgi:hypothetical protein
MKAHSGVFWFCATLLSTCGCTRAKPHGSPSPKPTQTLPMASVQSPAAAVSPVTVTPRLVLETEGKEAVVYLSVTELELKTPIAQIKDPWACLGVASGQAR